MDFKEIINSPGLWIVSSLMVIISVSQAIVFMRAAIKEADSLGIDKSKRKSAIRSATITAIGPSLAPVITLLTMVAIVGAPTTWMRLCDVGAARSEMGVLGLTSSITGAELGTDSFGLEACLTITAREAHLSYLRTTRRSDRLTPGSMRKILKRLTKDSIRYLKRHHSA